MAIIQSGATADLWTIDPISNAGRVTLYDVNGNALFGIGVVYSLDNILDALNEDVTLNLSGQATTAVQLRLTTGTLTASFEATINGTDWFSVNGSALGTNIQSSSVSVDGVWFIETSGYKSVRTRISSFTSGDTSVSMFAVPETRNGSISVSVTGSVTVIGSYADNTSNTTDKLPVLPAIAKSSAPSWTDGNKVPLTTLLSGQLRIDNTSWLGSTAPTVGQKTMSSSIPVVLSSDQSTIPISAASLPLPTGAATETTLAGVLTTTAFQARINTLGQKTMANSTPVVLSSDQTAIPITDNAGSLTVDGTITANIGTTNGLALDTTLAAQSMVDNAGFTDGTSRIVPAGYILDETAGTALTENDGAAARIDSKRAQIVVIEDATTRGQRLTITASNAMKVDGSAVTQPVSGTITANQGTSPWVTNITQFGSSAVVTGTGASGAGIPRVTVANDSNIIVSQATAANLNATVVGTATDNTTNSTAKLPVMAAKANTSAPSWTDGNMVPLSTDTSGNLRVTGNVTVDKSSTSTITSVAGSTSNTSILASNTSRILATVYNGTNKTMYLALASTASTSSYTIQMDAGSYWELPITYTGAISAVWANGVSGNALVTELT